jgi:hypothetical protein
MGAAWHRSQGLAAPGNIILLELPPYSPELNPVERIWHHLRSHWLANSVFSSLADIRMPARRPGTDLPTTTAWSARSARSLGPRLCPLCKDACYRTVACDRRHTQVRKYPEIRMRCDRADGKIVSGRVNGTGAGFGLIFGFRSHPVRPTEAFFGEPPAILPPRRVEFALRSPSYLGTLCRPTLKA